MIKFSSNVKYSNLFKKSLRKVIKQGKDIDKLLDVVDILADNKEKLPPKNCNHKLNNDKYYKDCYECHIEPNWLLIYKYEENDLVLLLVNTGSHNSLFQGKY